VPSDKRQRQRENSQARAASVKAAHKKQAQKRRLLVTGGIIVIVVGFIAVLTIQSGGKSKSTKVSSTPTSSPTTVSAAAGPPTAPPVPAGAKITGATPCPAANGSSPHTSTFAKAPPMCIDPTRTYTATFNTTEGNIVVALDTKTTPGTVNNFVVLSRYHYYDKTSFDRIDTSIDIIQGGSPSTQSISDPGPGYNIKDEGGKFTYSPGDLVMARTSGADSGAAQYFFVAGPNASGLDGQGTYVRFGHVSTGLDVLKKVEGLFEACNPNNQACLGGGPSRVVLVNGITITES
jgi:cyclophilin family peptidyl-prolyl cis-trans isomerase